MTPLQIQQIPNSTEFQKYAAGIRSLIGHYQHVLMDASCGNNPDMLLRNLAESPPHVWVITTAASDVLGLASLSDEVFGRHAYLHGMSHPRLRHHPIIAKTALTAIWYAFSHLNVLKVKAEFETDNPSAKGFCWRMGFQRAAHLKADNQVGMQLKDVALYTLSWEDFLKNTPRYRQLLGANHDAHL